MRPLILLLVLLFAMPAHATVYFEETFEDGSFDVGSGNPQPIWFWPSNTATTGANAWWKITNVDKHSGNWAMRLNYLARNGYGNTCGGHTVYQHASHGNQTYFVSSTGANLTQNPYFNSFCGAACDTLCTMADGGTHYLYNITKNFTRWTVSAISNQEATNDKLTLTDCVAGPGYTCGVDADIDVGDECYFTHACGIDGDICSSACPMTNCKPRRNDCGQHPLYLGGYDNSTFSWGSVQYRRFYFKFSSDYITPNAGGQKIGYWGTIDGSGTSDPYAAPNWNGTAVLKDGLAGFWAGNNLGWISNTAGAFPLALNTWYYFEEMQASESAPFAGDGHYTAWMAPDGETPVVILDLPNITLPPTGKSIGGVSIWGNSQFTRDRAGYVYIDDIKISDTYNGPTDYVAPYCGDGSCNGSETCATCEADCGECPATCGDEVCDEGETCQTCPEDCGQCPPAGMQGHRYQGSGTGIVITGGSLR